MTREDAAREIDNTACCFSDKRFRDAMHMAAAALRGPQPDSETGLMPCVYCNDTDEQANLFEENNYAPYSGMESAISINRQQDGRHIVCADLWKDGNVVADFEIFYCPMCGRKLEVEE